MVARQLQPGLSVSALSLEGILEKVLAAASGTSPPLALGYLNAHVLAKARRCRWLCSDLGDLDLLVCDGWSIRLALQVAGGPAPPRHTGADWVYELASMAATRGVALGWWGGEPGRAEQAAAALCAAVPGLEVRWTAAGDSHPRDDLRKAAEARRAGVDVLLLGLGTPRQEAVARQLRGRPDAPPAICCLGGTADVLSGAIPRGPRWMTEHGLEWAWRLRQEPVRLWDRYLASLPAETLRLAAWSARERIGSTRAPRGGVDW